MKILLAGIMVAAMITNAQAESYYVNRSFSQFGNTATLIGTLDLPLGNYTIVNMGPSPFTSVNLTLTVNSASYYLDNAVTSLISGTGTFLINATPTSLIFNTANANGVSPADLVFSETSEVGVNYYAIGTDGAPSFEIANTVGVDVLRSAAMPVVFGVVPEPGTFALFVVGAAFIVRRRSACSG